MARNKYPQETVRKIVKTATRLFSEQGYDTTSIQDIVNHLDGLSKGAIYHHFHSKEEILDAVAASIFRESESRVADILQDSSLTGLEKLQRILSVSFENDPQEQMFSLSVNMLKNPRVLAMQLQGTIEETARKVMLPIVREGIADGSLAGMQYPEEFAEAFLLLVNVWLNPMIYVVTQEELLRKCRFMQHMVLVFGVPTELISDDMIEKLKKYALLYAKNQK